MEIWLGYNVSFNFFFNDTATTEIYTLSLHDALPICSRVFLQVKQWQCQDADLMLEDYKWKVAATKFFQ